MSYQKFDSMEKLVEAVKDWGKARWINNPMTQASKVTEEWGETVAELNHGRFDDAFKDGIGDTLVSLIIFADICGVDCFECLEQAYNEIKDRKGKTVDGNFIKEA